jgi:hypothetical protein
VAEHEMFRETVIGWPADPPIPTLQWHRPREAVAGAS